MITILQNIPKVTPAFNAVVFSVCSTEQTRTDFRYNVVIKDASGNVVATKKPVGGSLVSDVTFVDLSNVLARLQSLGTWRYNVTGSDYIYYDARFRPGYSVEISEFYSLSLHNTVTISGKYTMPSALHLIKFPFYNYTDIATNGKWLTNFDFVKVHKTDKLVYSYFCQLGGVASVKYTFYDKDGTYFKTVSIANPFPAVAEDVLHFHCGLDDIKTLTGLTSGEYLNVGSYEVIPLGGAAMRFVVVPGSCKHGGVRLHYINEWGAVDSFNFDLALRRGVSIEKKKAKLKLNGSQLRPSIYGVGTSPYLVKYTDNLKITSDYITDNDSNALLELFTSPLVSVETEQNLFFPSAPGNKLVLPCEIDLTSYDIKSSRIDKLFNVELEVKISVDNTRQSL